MTEKNVRRRNRNICIKSKNETSAKMFKNKGKIEVPRDVQKSKSTNMTDIGGYGLSI